MLFLSIPDQKYLSSSVCATNALELRLDLFSNVDIAFISEILSNDSQFVMLALRKDAQGGKFNGEESHREALIETYLRLNPPFFDLEYDMRPAFIHSLLDRYPKTKFILSYHQFRGLISLNEIYSYMQQFPVFTYKMAVMIDSAIEALKWLVFTKKHPKISLICMGEKASFARVLGPIVGNLVDYASMRAKAETAPGQISYEEWMEIYRYPDLNRDTEIYGLIGDPIHLSPGHLYHNGVFKKRNRNAVYVKIPLPKEDLACFIPLAKELGVRGLSVTVPHKESIFPFVDEMDESAKQIGAINTLLFKEGKIIGTNTDGLGALDAIEKKSSVKGKRVVLLGAGGSARAVAFEAKQRGANVLVLNRTVERAKKMAEDLGCEFGDLNELPSLYDILINCSLASMPIDPEKILPGKIAMDVVYSPKETLFLKEALLKGNQVVYGEEMFFNQAARQTAFWIGA